MADRAKAVARYRTGALWPTRNRALDRIARTGHSSSGASSTSEGNCSAFDRRPRGPGSEGEGVGIGDDRRVLSPELLGGVDVELDEVHVGVSAPPQRERFPTDLQVGTVAVDCDRDLAGQAALVARRDSNVGALADESRAWEEDARAIEPEELFDLTSRGGR
jgi:hypothetical protein